MNKKVISIIAIIALVAVLCVCLAACNAESYEKKLKDAGYTVSVYEGDEADKKSETGDYDVKWVIIAAKGGLLDAEIGTIAKFEKLKDAKAFAEKLEGTIGAVHRTGSVVIWGSNDFVEDAK